MAIILTVDTIAEAIDAAETFRRAGDYDLFRGQRRNWPVVSSSSRLDEEARDEAKARLERFAWWVTETPGLEPYADHDFSIMAVAQHYGLPTPFVDFSTNPAVAGFFAGDGVQPGDVAALLCVNEQDFADTTQRLVGINGQLDVLLRYLRFERPETPNLWRMQTQACVFLNNPAFGASIEGFIYDFDRILIRHPAQPTPKERAFIYPTRKSDLERLLEQFFSLEKRRPALAALRAMLADSVPNEGHFEMPDVGDFYLRKGATPHDSWGFAEPTVWVEGTLEVEPFALCDSIFELDCKGTTEATLLVDIAKRQLETALTAGTLVRARTESFKILNAPPGGDPDAIARCETWLATLWDGMRRLAFSDQQVARSLACLLCFSLSADGESTLIVDPIRLELAAQDGAYVRALADAARLRSAIRPDLSSVLKPEYATTLTDDVNRALLWVNRPQMLFTFEGFLEVLCHDILPSQMGRANDHHARLFSPMRITTCGLP